ncbi:MAG: hypothetical protein MI866_15390 [Bacteroidales bacterium]|nr:hypothetical protein [Bacteroidales bacterium]
MKKILILSAMLLLCWQIDAQRIVVNGKVPEKGLNSPNNYFGYRPEYKDTLYIDFGEGQKMEIVYRWFDLFREDEQKYQKYFWIPFKAKFDLLTEKIKELPLHENVKYTISIKEKTDNRHFVMQNAFHYNDHETMTRIARETHASDGSKMKQYFENQTVPPDDSSLKANMEKFFLGKYPKESIISVQERKHNLEHREYKLVGNRLAGQAQWQHIIEIKDRDWQVNFFVNDVYDLSAFESVDLSKFFRTEKENYIRKKYYMSHTVLNYKVIDGKVRYQYTPRERKRSRSRYINIRWSPVVGTSIVNSQWSADLGAQIGICFNDKQQWANRLSLRYQLKGIGEEDVNGRSMRYNGFVDALWDINLADDYKREKWVGAGLGYLVHKEGNLYGDNTARVFLKYRSSQLWGLQPEFNYSFKENKGFIGLGFLFTL